MKKHISILTVLIAIFCLAAACISTQEQEGVNPAGDTLLKDAGETNISEENSATAYTLDETLRKFYASTDTKSERDRELTEYIETGGHQAKVYQIIGVGVNRDAAAGSWILGLRYGSNASLLYPEKTGWHESSWPGPLPEEEINTEALLMPSEIFSNNPGEADSLFEKSVDKKTSVVLRNGIYYISPEGSDLVYEVKFNAYTGEVIP